MELPAKERFERVKVAVKEREKNADLLFLELVEKVKQHERVTLDIARLVYELHGLGITDQRISERLASAGVQLARATITTYRNVWQFFVVQHGLINDIQSIPMNILIALRSYAITAHAPTERVKRILAELRGMGSEKAMEHLREEFADQRRESNHATLRIERPIYDMFERVQKKLSAVSQATGGEPLSPTQTLEFVLKLFDEADMEALKELWLKEHGEESA